MFSITSKMKKKMKKLLFCLFTSKYSPALAQALQSPPDKAGPLSKPLGAGGEATATHSALTQRRFLSPQPGAAARLQGEAGDGQGKGAQKGLFPDVPKAAGGERRRQPRLSRGSNHVLSTFSCRWLRVTIPGARAAGSSRHTGNTAEGFDGLKAPSPAQNYHAPQFLSVPCLRGLFLCCPATEIPALVAGHIRGLLLAVHHGMAFREPAGKKCSITG